MGLDIKTAIITVLGVGVIVSTLKHSGLKTKILPFVSVALGVLIYTSMGILDTETIVVGAFLGAATSGIYDAKEAFNVILNIKVVVAEFIKGISTIKLEDDILNQLGEQELPPKSEG